MNDINVFLVWWNSDLLGVFSTEEKAQAFIDNEAKLESDLFDEPFSDTDLYSIESITMDR